MDYTGKRFKVTRPYAVYGMLKQDRIVVVINDRNWGLENPIGSWIVEKGDLEKGIANGYLVEIDSTGNRVDLKPEQPHEYHKAIVTVVKRTNSTDNYDTRMIGKSAMLIYALEEYPSEMRWFMLQETSEGASPADGNKYGCKCSWAMEADWTPEDALKRGSIKLVSKESTKTEMNIKERATTIMNSITKKIKSILRTEPEKSLIAQGVTSEDGSLTADGRDAFIDWQFNQNKTAFYEAVVKPIVDSEAKK